MLWTLEKQFDNDGFETESQLETAILQVAKELFGPNRIYLDVKRRIGAKGKTKNIPDGYLLDLTSKKKPQLFVVENELASHDPLDHIAKQILEFSLSFEKSQFRIKTILKDALKADKEALALCETYIATNGYDSLDHLLDALLYRDDAFNALVIIDDLEEELETVLLRRFKFPVEVLTLRRFTSKAGETAYEFEPFLEGIAGPTAEIEAHASAGASEMDPSELDTIVVPAQKEGFHEVFLGENRWYQIRIHASMVSRIKYIAAYQSAPVSAITHVAPVKSIAHWKDGLKYVLTFTEPAKPIGPLKLVPKPKGKTTAPQAPRYTSYARLMQASNLDQVF